MLCDTCGEYKSVNDTKMRSVCGGIYICDQCVNRILTLYVSCNPIKVLCPLCHEKEGNVEKCEYCNIKTLEEVLANDNKK